MHQTWAEMKLAYKKSMASLDEDHVKVVSKNDTSHWVEGVIPCLVLLMWFIFMTHIAIGG